MRRLLDALSRFDERQRGGKVIMNKIDILGFIAIFAVFLTLCLGLLFDMLFLPFLGLWIALICCFIMFFIK